MNVGQKIMADYNFITKYAQRKEDGTKESWDESVDRIYDMHEYRYVVEQSAALENAMDFAKRYEKAKKILSAQRFRQFAVPDFSKGILKHNTKAYNCSGTYVDRPEVFDELMYILLSGAGAGVSIQHRHISNLPPVSRPNTEMKEKFIVEDSIEGWASAIKKLTHSYFEKDRYEVDFDYSSIRAKGELIAGQFAAPGHEPLEHCIKELRGILDTATKNGERKLKSIEIYDMVMFIAEAVLSGGIRRSAILVLFDVFDEDMLSAKVGQYWIDNPQRAMSNNSAVILKTEADRGDFDYIMKKVRSVGEPGFALVDNYDIVYNPCFEVGMLPYFIENGIKYSGWSFCNLTEINGALIKTKEDFYLASKAAAIAGTLQAGYTDFKYLGKWTKHIVERDALIGVSITGILNSPNILLNPEVLQLGAREVNKTNKYIAGLLGINEAARTTVVKPAGNSSILLGTASGIHAEEAHKYLRNIKANENEIGVRKVLDVNPHMVNRFNDNNLNISFAIKPNRESIVKKDNLGVDALKIVALVQANWILPGTVRKETYGIKVNHNVSNTINVAPHQWDEVADYLWENRGRFTGVSLIGTDSVLSYKDAPFQTVKEPEELAKEYGSAAILASGLITDGMQIFNHLWDATDRVIKNDFDKDIEDKPVAERIMILRKKDWVRRVKKFAHNYTEGDIDKAIRCLKEVSILHKFNKIRNESEIIDWSTVDFSKEAVKRASELEAACAGNGCEVV